MSGTETMALRTRSAVGTRRGRAYLATIATVVVTLAIALGAAVALVGSGARDLSQALRLPSPLQALARRDDVAYPFHAGLGMVLDWVGGPPSAAGLQWLKAADHARTDAEIDRAAQGIALAKQRSADGDYLEALFCVAAVQPANGRPILAVMRAGLFCGDRPPVRGRVPNDVPISYPDRPPTSGLFYEVYPRYGVTEQPIAPYNWVHNLAHGAIVLLYNCPEGCPELVAQVRQLHAELPPGRNARSGLARLLATPYADMDSRIAVLAWDRRLELEAFDRDLIAQFYLAHLDRGPECQALVCDE